MGWDVVSLGLLTVNAGGEDKQDLCLGFERSQEKLEEPSMSPQKEDIAVMTFS